MSGSTIWRRVAGTAVLVAALVPGAAGAGSVGDTPRLDAVPPPATMAASWHWKRSRRTCWICAEHPMR
ncbi:hypothetical protein ACQCR9_24525, partial [Ralstonia pseudosolanacearum]